MKVLSKKDIVKLRNDMLGKYVMVLDSYRVSIDFKGVIGTVLDIYLDIYGQTIVNVSFPNGVMLTVHLKDLKIIKDKEVDKFYSNLLPSFKINKDILDSLYELRLAENSKKYMEDFHREYGAVALLALLGLDEEKKVIDRFTIPMVSGGCSDSPDISFKSMDLAFKQLIEQNRICAGMICIRPAEVQSSGRSITGQLRINIHGFKKSFTNIKETLWGTVTKEHLSLYCANYDEKKRIVITPIDINLVINKTKGSCVLLKENNKLATKEARAILKRNEAYKKKEADRIKSNKKKEDDKKAKAKLDAIAKKKYADELRRKESRLKAKKKRTDKQFSEKKAERIDIGAGYCMIKNKNGEYILWQDK